MQFTVLKQEGLKEQNSAIKSNIRRKERGIQRDTLAWNDRTARVRWECKPETMKCNIALVTYFPTHRQVCIWRSVLKNQDV